MRDMAENACDELLRLIQKKDEDSEAADAAWCELWRRHAGRMHQRLTRSRRLVGHGFDEDDVIQKTFASVYLDIADDFQPGEYRTANDAANHVGQWLYQVARRQLLKMTASREAALEVPLEPQSIHDEIRCDEVDVVLSADETAVRTAAEEALTEDELNVLWLKLQYMDNDGESKPPDEELSALAADLGVKPATIRKKYERAVAKVANRLAALSASNIP